MYARWLAILLLSTLLPPQLPRGHAGEIPKEYQIKAKYLVNIPLYTEFPPQAMKGECFNICLIGDTPLADALEAYRGKLIQKRPLSIKVIDEVGQLDRCQVLFIASSERYHLQTLLPEAQHRGTLTVSDMRDFARQGGMINLQTVDKRVIFDLNRSAATKAAISFSAHLLKLARDVIVK